MTRQTHKPWRVLRAAAPPVEFYTELAARIRAELDTEKMPDAPAIVQHLDDDGWHNCPRPHERIAQIGRARVSS